MIHSFYASIGPVRPIYPLLCSFLSSCLCWVLVWASNLLIRFLSARIWSGYGLITILPVLHLHVYRISWASAAVSFVSTHKPCMDARYGVFIINLS